MRRFVAAFAFVLGLVLPVFAEDYVPDRRLVVTKDVDFYGSDLQALFDTNRKSCRNACLSDPNCKAFTFNSRSNSCFPKSSISDRQPYEGAVSAEVLTLDPAIARVVQARGDDLDRVLSDRDLSAALSQARGIGPLHPGGNYSVEAILDAAESRRSQGDMLNAMRWTGAAVAETDRSDQWVEYGRLSLAIKAAKSNDQWKYANRGMQAATNGYLRALNDAQRVNALSVMTDALERMDRGRDTIPVLRLAESIQPREELTARLDKAIAKWGFRITEHNVESDKAEPRVCATFSERLMKTGVDYTPYVKLPDQRMSVEAEGKRICIGGATHGERYTVTFREGLPAQDGEKLIKDVELRFYVRDRSPSVHFAGRAYVLPKAADAAVPVQTVNLSEVDLKLRRISDRNVLRSIQENYFGKRISYWNSRNFAGEIGEEVWTGKGQVENAINRDMTTRLPVGDLIKDLDPGVYALTATIPGEDEYDSEGATQWFVLTDLGLTTMSGADGLHVFVRSLGDAQARAGVKATLVSRSNRVLGTAMTDDQGYARFDGGLTRGRKGAEPGLIVVEDGETDMAFLSLADPAFDLSDRGVEGRAPAGPIDVFLTTDRGAYRAGEVINATVLARDGVATAIDDLPLTAILTRPDGVEYARHFSGTSVAGGHVFNMPVGNAVPRGTWRLDIKADVDQPALASQTVLVEDFLPERIDFELKLPTTPLRPGTMTDLTVTANYLFGAPGSDLPVEGDTILRAKRSVADWPGYVFGRHDTQIGPRRGYFDGGRTGPTGVAVAGVDLPGAPAKDRPLEVEIITRVSEGSGRPVERRITQAVAPDGPVIGIKPMFEDVVEEGTEAHFQVIALSPDLKPVAMPAKWTLNRVNRRYQWYKEYGDWNWEVITTRKPVASGEVMLGSTPVEVSGKVDWGSYELVVERPDGEGIASSADFYAGWYVPADTTKTPDVLELSLDRPDYKSGDTARLRIVPRYAGTALVTVMSNRLIAMKAVEVVKGENLIPLDVTDDWGAGAYVTASVIRPMDVAAGQNPARSMGLAHARIDPGAKQLNVSFDAPEQSAPRGPMIAAVQVDGLEHGTEAYVTVAAVDVGILNLTGFQSPDPSEHYFGQRRLGMDIRDVYGRLIDGMSGSMGAVRSGGDAQSEAGMQSPPPTEELVAYFSGPVRVARNGRAEVVFDMPEFNGTVRLMAVAWSKDAVGEAEADVLVRDPVVVTASLPRYLSPGDSSRLLLEIVHAEGPTGRMGLDVTAQGVSLSGNVPSGVTLGEQEKAIFSIPITAGDVGDHSLRVALTTPDGKQLTKNLVMPVRMNDPVIAVTQRFNLAAGGTFKLDHNVFSDMKPGTGSAVVSAGPLAKLDAPGLLSALDRYPYGCTEQVTSVAMPLLYFGPVAKALGLGARDKVDERIDQAIERVLARQASSGGFGLWYPSSGDLWLDAYVSDFLSRAKAEGYEVPQIAFRMAMDNLRNRVNYHPDFDEGGSALAYALLVLAREGAAAMADLRYYSDEKAEAFSTALGVAQVGAALAMYGDQTRADRMFARAGSMIGRQTAKERQVWRADYGTNLRDAAGVLTLAVEAGSNAVDREALAARIGGAVGRRSTQESVWTLMAARALVVDPSIAGLTMNGQPVEGPLVKLLEEETLGYGVGIRNESGRDTDVTLTTFGVPQVAPPAGGYGYRIDRVYYTMEGEMIETLSPKVGDRYVVALKVTPFEKGEARLMVDDPLPAGFEIDNPNLLRSGDIQALDWLKPQHADHAEFRSDRFLAAVDWRKDKPFQLAYIVRAVSPGEFHHPAAQVEDMYRPQYRAQSATGRFSISE
ncbi:alpha-2-macroglobulin family protein [Alisedimentitalea sp. MJ-SS2]|uniref:alpha-2-macroglobulin family protein n=1 Tax=Aliisedimentitalea sp. MJ-SS2 TaxID=3049795 RepID=UPI00290DBA92|nr:alpha-2-macroglobulin family protein [Alisedimentitalea sp. MJ-SS2]MDU8929449.1 alpha-2-macroglobulin family protein [Alisedimentitalea sp. MJ-SS2]